MIFSFACVGRGEGWFGVFEGALGIDPEFDEKPLFGSIIWISRAAATSAKF